MTTNNDYLMEHLTNFLFKNKKSENEMYNSIREKCIDILLNHIKDKNEVVPDGWSTIFNNLKKSLTDYGIQNINTVQRIGNRSNTDFKLNITMNNMNKNIDFEFKNGANNMESLPQFLQLYTHSKIKIINYDYHRFYYDYYLDKVILLANNNGFNLIKPSYNIYIGKINNAKDKNTWQRSLRQFYDKYTELMNNVVIESITDFINQYGKAENINIQNLNSKLEKQKNKVYLLTQNGDFKVNDIQSYMKVLSLKSIKNNNTLVFDTINNGELHCLLRWKNGNGCIGPAWQIKLKTN